MEKVSEVLTVTMQQIFAVDNILSSHADNCKNNLFVLGEGDIFGIYGSF